MSSYIPQELLFQISEYGPTHPDLTSQYIAEATSPYNVNWPFQFSLRYIISQCPVYAAISQCNSSRVHSREFPNLNLYINYNDDGIRLSSRDNPFNDILVFRSTKQHLRSTMHVIDYLFPYCYDGPQQGYTYSDTIRSLERIDHRHLHDSLPDIFPRIPTDSEIIEAMRSIDVPGLPFNMGKILSISRGNGKIREKYVGVSELTRYIVESSWDGSIVDMATEPTGSIGICYNMDSDVSRQLQDLIFEEYSEYHSGEHVTVNDEGSEMGHWVTIRGLPQEIVTYYNNLANDLRSVLCPYE